MGWPDYVPAGTRPKPRVRGRAIDPGYFLPSVAAEPFNPLTLPVGSWFKAFWAEDPDWTPPADGGAVSSWRNAGTISGDAEQATGINQPLYIASVPEFNDRPAIRSDGVNDYLRTATFTAQTQPGVVVWVGRIRATTGAHFVLDGGSSTVRWAVYDGNTQNLWSLFGQGGPLISPVPSTDLIVGYGVFNAASSSLQADGLVTTTGTTGTAYNIDRVTLFTGNGLTNYANCDLAFIGLHAGAMDAADKTYLIDGLLEHYRPNGVYMGATTMPALSVTTGTTTYSSSID